MEKIGNASDQFSAEEANILYEMTTFWEVVAAVEPAQKLVVVVNLFNLYNSMLQ